MRSSNGAARAAIVLGVLAVVAIPAAVAVSELTARFRLLETLYAGVPLALCLGLVSLVLARRARFAAARSIRGGGTRWPRFWAWAGTYAGVTGALALAVYGVLRWAQ
jgi:hypothetical protein